MTAAALLLLPLIWLDELSLPDVSINSSPDGNSLRIYTQDFPRGVSSVAPKRLHFSLKDTELFEAVVGIDAETLTTANGTVRFRVIADGKVVADSGILTKRKRAKLSADLRGCTRLALDVSDGGDGADGDHADWCNAVFTLAEGGSVVPVSAPETPQFGILSPPSTPPTLWPGRPPLGWNSWNCFGLDVSDAKIRAAAKALVSSGLAAHGWNTIVIDDGWQGKRIDGVLHPNECFPNMPALCAYIHSLGLKVGIYSSPGPTTCGGLPGSYDFEERDAAMFASWKIDFLKYDWCSYSAIANKRNGIPELKRQMEPFLKMGEALRKTGREIEYSLCQYGMANVPAWGRKTGASQWRVTQDITDTWQSIRSIAEAMDGLEIFSAPSSWNDPDMLVVGTIGWGEPRKTRLTPNEQFSHITLWTLFSAPLFLGCDLQKLDAFTLSLLTNDEVLAIQQDKLSAGASRTFRSEVCEVWQKPLADGSVAIGVFNLDPEEADMDFPFDHPVRDIWRHAELPSIPRRLPGHACFLGRKQK